MLSSTSSYNGHLLNVACLSSQSSSTFVAALSLRADLYFIHTRGVCNPMKMLDIGFLKTKLNPTDLKIQKLKTQFPQFNFQKTDFGGLGTVFHVVSFMVHLPT